MKPEGDHPREAQPTDWFSGQMVSGKDPNLALVFQPIIDYGENPTPLGI
jgi:hypothetical protein